MQKYDIIPFFQNFVAKLDPDMIRLLSHVSLGLSVAAREILGIVMMVAMHV